MTKKEPCIFHPWATDEENFCWKCEEDRSEIKLEFMDFQKVNKQIQRPKDDITWSVVEDLASRAERGYVKYNTTLQENNHQNMLQHAYEEALDLAQYLKKEITTLNTVQQMVESFDNDTELGKAIRKKYGQK